MKVIFFAKENLSLTGGNLYDTLLYQTIQQETNFTVEYCEPKIYKSGFAFKKLITPFLELKWWNKLKKNDIYFWNSVDAYHCFLVVSCIKLFLTNKKVCVIHHHYKFVEMSGIKKIIFKFFEINFLRMASFIIIPSPYILSQTQKFLPKNKISYLELAFEDTHIDLQEVCVKSGQMLFVGNIEHRKGLHLLLDSLHVLKVEGHQFIVNILGSVIDPKYYENLLLKVKEYALEENVFFRGRVSNEEKWNYLKTSDIFVFPSLLEGYGIVIMEAMSYGLPVVAFNNSAIPFTVKDGYNGLLVDNKNVQGLKNTLSKILNDSSLRETLSVGAFETFSNSRRTSHFIKDIKNFISDLKS